MPLAECVGEDQRRVCHQLPARDSATGPGGGVGDGGEIIEYILYSKKVGCLLTGPESMDLTSLNVLKGE